MVARSAGVSEDRVLEASAKDDLAQGQRDLMWDAAFATFVGVFASGVVLVAFALHKGASNVVVGVLAATPFLTQLLQAPAVRLIERLGRRRRIATLSLLGGRLMLLAFLAAVFLPNALALPLILAAAVAHFGLNAVAACAWNSWIRDLIPRNALGAFFARRSLYAGAVAAIGGVGAGLALERSSRAPQQADAVFASLFLLALICGLISTWRLAQAPEPPMRPVLADTPLWRQLLAPLRDDNFRSVIAFGGLWQFAVNLATPFFTLYFLQDLGLGLGAVMALTVVSQLANLALLRMWGAMSDRFSNKSVLLVAAPTFLICVAAVALTRSLEDQALRIGYLAALHIVMGIASAGIGIATGNIVLKLAPSDGATPYLGANALATSLAAGAAPIMGGMLADYFSVRRLSMLVSWTDPDRPAATLEIGLTGWEFYFAGAAVIGLLALHRLALIKEEGEIEGREMMHQLMLQVRRSVMGMSTVAGQRVANAFPDGALIDLRQRRGRRGKGESGDGRKDNPRQPG